MSVSLPAVTTPPKRFSVLVHPAHRKASTKPPAPANGVLKRRPSNSRRVITISEATEADPCRPVETAGQVGLSGTTLTSASAKGVEPDACRGSRPGQRRRPRRRAAGHVQEPPSRQVAGVRAQERQEARRYRRVGLRGR